MGLPLGPTFTTQKESHSLAADQNELRLKRWNSQPKTFLCIRSSKEASAEHTRYSIKMNY